MEISDSLRMLQTPLFPWTVSLPMPVLPGMAPCVLAGPGGGWWWRRAGGETWGTSQMQLQRKHSKSLFDLLSGSIGAHIGDTTVASFASLIGRVCQQRGLADEFCPGWSRLRLPAMPS